MAARRTPDFILVQQAASASFLLGALIAFPGAMAPVWSLHLNLDHQTITRLFLILFAGVLVGTLGGRRLLRHLKVHTLASLAGVIASLSVAGLATAYFPERLWTASLGLGLSIGLLTLAQSSLLFPPVAASPHSLALGLFFFGSGAITLIALVFAIIDTLVFTSVALLIAALPLLFALHIWGAESRLRGEAREEGLRFHWRALASPASLLLALVVLLHGAVFGAAVGWLAMYLARKFGTSVQLSLMILSLFWLSLTAGSLAAKRLPPLENRVRWLVWIGLGFVVGCSFLLETTTTSGAVAGTLILGSAGGALQTLIVGWLHRHVDWRHLASFRALAALFVCSTLGAAYFVGHLVSLGSVHSIVWAILVTSLVLAVSLGVLLVETRLVEKRSTVN